MITRLAIGLLAVLWLLAGIGAGWPQSVDELDAEGAEYLRQARDVMRATRFDEAWALLGRASAHFEALDDAAGRIHTAIATADYHMHTQGGALVFEAIDRALMLAERHDLIALKAHALKQASQYLADAGRFEEAWNRLEEAEAIYRDLGDTRRLIDIQVFASLLASRAGDDARAAELAARALPGARAAGRERMTVHALSILGYSQQRLGDFEAAMSTYDRLIPMAWELGDRLQLNHAYCTVGEIKRHMGLIDGSEADLAGVIESLEESRHQLLSSPARRSAYLERQVEAYSRLAALLVDDRRPNEALELIDRFRSLSFLDHLAQVEISRLSGADPAWQAREKKLLTSLARAHAQQQPAPAGGDAPVRGVPATQERGNKRSLLEAQLQELRAEYWHSRHRPSSPIAPEPVPIGDVQKSLAEGEALIVYWLLDERVLAWVVTDREIEFTNIPVTRGELAAVVEDFAAPMRWPWRARDLYLAGREQAHIESGRKLYRWLIESLPPAARHAGDWMIVPDGFLHELPWAALIRDCPAEPGPGDDRLVHRRYAGCSWLIEDHTIRIGISPSALAYQRNRSAGVAQAPADSILILAPEFSADSALGLPALPHAARESSLIAEGFPNASVLTGSEATRAQFAWLAAQHRTIHLATHGLLDDDHPLSSGVVLASGQDPAGGLLTAAEVLTLDIDADLVSLASCRSGSGRISRAEGRQGLAQAFVHAGAGQVLVSMWDLRDDHAAVLLPAFYRARQQEHGAHRALRQAQLAHLERVETMTLVVDPANTALAHPRFWAGFQLVGTP